MVPSLTASMPGLQPPSTETMVVLDPGVLSASAAPAAAGSLMV